MKENVDNNDNISNNNIKDLMNYFNYNIQRDSLITKEQINSLNLKKNKINLSLLYNEYINSNSDINTNNNNIKDNNILNDIKKVNDNYYHEIINTNLIDIKNNTLSFIDNIKNQIETKYSNFSDLLSNWLKKKR